jgi:large subunit ribosomal protein L32e
MEVKEKKQKRESLKKYKFIRVDSLRKKLKKRWIRPKAWHHNKPRKKDLVRIRNVRVGYKTPKDLRGVHPSGYEEVLVSNVNDLKKVDPKIQAVKIRKIGRKKKQEILKEAEKLKIKVLNPGVKK